MIEKQNIYEDQFVKNLFNRMSGSYERMNYITSFGFSILWRSQFVKIFPRNNENLEIIDLLSGMGETWDSILKNFPNAKLTALDFSEGMTHYAKRKNKKKFNGAIKILQDDILNSNLPSIHYDFVFCGFGLKTFNEEQLQIFAKEVYRILKPGGQFSFIDVSEPKNIFINFFYKFYLKNLIPILGKVFLGSPEEYKMLWSYTSKFRNAEKATEIFKENNLTVQFTQYFYGCATGFKGKK